MLKGMDKDAFGTSINKITNAKVKSGAFA